MRARVYCPVGDVHIDHEFTDEVVVGRGKESSLRLAPDLLSKRHARIFWHPASLCYLVEDLGSTNGTALDGEKVKRPVPLGHMHVITLAERFDLVFQDLERCAVRSPAPSRSSLESADSETPRPPSENTSVVPLPVPLPTFLREPAEKSVTEGTFLQRLLPLPSFLQREREEATGIDQAPAVPVILRQPKEPERQADSVSLRPTIKVSGGSKTAKASSTVEDLVTGHAAEQAAMADEAAKLLSQIDGETSDGDTAAGASAAAGVFSLRLSVDDKVRVIELEAGENIVGRGADCRVQIKKPEVSRQHAMLLVDGGRLRIRDLGSHNKTFVDDRAIEWEIDLAAGQEVRFGSIPAIVLYLSADIQSEQASKVVIDNPRRRQ